MTSKRLFDISFSSLALSLLFPALIVIGVLIKLTSKGPALFRQRRMGFNQKEFIILKFRTMYDGTGRSGVDLTSKGDLRITAIGRFLRQSRLDELPQFLNVLHGDMSVVGPRPYEITSAHRLNGQSPRSMLRYTVKPGITGLAQIYGRKGKNITDMEEDIGHDLEYVRTRCMALDIAICLRTFVVMFDGRGI